ncbi:MAG: YtxH domain-containing protein [Gemmatimonadaceae bacterium]
MRPAPAEDGQFEAEEMNRPARPRRPEADTDWAQIGALGAGIAIGLAVGAGIALLLAPMSGEDTRDLIGDRTRALRGRASERWDDLRDELRHAAHRGRRRVRRGAARGRWKAEDAYDRARR